MANWKIRLTQERDELKDRMNKLDKYVDEVYLGTRTQEMSDFHLDLMRKQLKAMNKYLTILNARIGYATQEIPTYKRN